MFIRIFFLDSWRLCLVVCDSQAFSKEKIKQPSLFAMNSVFHLVKDLRTFPSLNSVGCEYYAWYLLTIFV